MRPSHSPVPPGLLNRYDLVAKVYLAILLATEGAGVMLLC